MAMNNTEFQEYLKKTLEEQKDIYIPVNSSFIEKIIIHNAKCTDIHPNPDDEFCYPDVGPSYRIMGEYERDIREKMNVNSIPVIEPLIVMKTHPKGYMLVNGHHRWGAAIKVGVKRMPVKVINMMLEEDIKNLLERSDHDKRVTLDLDEVVFRSPYDEFVEKTKGVIARKTQKRIRLGVPALFRYLKTHGYDIWVYSSNYYSIDTIQLMFRRYSVHVDGIICGNGKKGLYDSNKSSSINELIANKYKTTVHIDNNSIVITKGKESQFEEFEIRDADELWSKDLIQVFERIDNNDDQ